MLEWATTLEEPFSRHQEKAHFTGSALVVDVQQKRVALLLHKKLQRWLQPGGHADVLDNGQMARTALREAQEETGCRVHLHPTAPQPFDLDIHLIPERPNEAAHCHLDVRFRVVAENPEAMAFDAAESSGARWLGFDEAIDFADDVSLKRLLQKGKAFLQTA